MRQQQSFCDHSILSAFSIYPDDIVLFEKHTGGSTQCLTPHPYIVTVGRRCWKLSMFGAFVCYGFLKPASKHTRVCVCVLDAALIFQDLLQWI